MIFSGFPGEDQNDLARFPARLRRKMIGGEWKTPFFPEAADRHLRFVAGAADAHPTGYGFGLLTIVHALQPCDPAPADRAARTMEER